MELNGLKGAVGLNKMQDVKIAVVGNVDAGKSSLIGTLLKGKNDDGRGCNREIIMNYPHEKQTGQTSSISHQIVGFREDGTVVNVEHKSKKESWNKIMRETFKLITFVDLAGHEKYLKTTIHGISCNHPDYALILVEARGVKGMTKEHIMLAMTFGIPFIVLVTKVDLYPAEIVNKTVEHIGKLLKQIKKDVWIVREDIDLEIPLRGKFVPIFTISNVTGVGLDLFKRYLFRIPNRIDYTPFENDPFEMSVIETFNVQGIGTVAHVFLAKGTARVGDQVLVGPDSVGKYHKSKLRTIQFKRMNVDFVLPGRHCTVSLPGIDRKLVKSGVYVLHGSIKDPPVVTTFIADIKVLTTHPTTIKPGYCPILNIDNIRMPAKIVSISQNDQTVEYLRGGGRATITFSLHRPAYIKADTTFIFREGKTRGFGKVKDKGASIA